MYYQTHLSLQACHLALVTEAAIAAVSHSPLNIHPTNTFHWIPLILPGAILSVLSNSSIIRMCFEECVTVSVYLSYMYMHAFSLSVFGVHSCTFERKKVVYTHTCLPCCHGSLEYARGCCGCTAGEGACAGLPQ